MYLLKGTMIWMRSAGQRKGNAVAMTAAVAACAFGLANVALADELPAAEPAVQEVQAASEIDSSNALPSEDLQPVLICEQADASIVPAVSSDGSGDGTGEVVAEQEEVASEENAAPQEDAVSQDGALPQDDATSQDVAAIAVESLPTDGGLASAELDATSDATIGETSDSMVGETVDETSVSASNETSVSASDEPADDTGDVTIDGTDELSVMSSSGQADEAQLPVDVAADPSADESSDDCAAAESSASLSADTSLDVSLETALSPDATVSVSLVSEDATSADDSTSVHAAGWEGETYYDEEGNLVKGSAFVDGAWRWFDELTGAMAKNAWVESDAGARYYGSDGTLATGETTVDGVRRAFDPATGIAETSAFVEDDQGTVRYYDANGAELSGGEYVASGATRLFGDDGAMTVGMVGSGAGARLYDAAGARVEGLAPCSDGALRYFEPGTGAMVTGLTVTSDGATRLFGDDGAMQTGERYVNGLWHFFDESNGHMLSSQECINRVLARAWACVGMNEQQAWDFLWDAHINHGADWCEYGPCTATIWHFFYDAGLGHFFTGDYVPGWPHQAYDWLAARGRISQTPQVGSVVFFKYPNNYADVLGLSAEHAEIVISVNSDGTITSIGALHGGIYPKQLPMYGIAGYGIPDYLLY
jgi:glucan-binding YG repeat protein